jgi:hypothetical protein
MFILKSELSVFILESEPAWRLPEPSDGKNKVVRPVELGTKNHCTGKGQEKFSSQSVFILHSNHPD